MLEVSGITKCYGNKTAVDNISFKVNQGEIVGFLGTNGAGKSTTMNIITGYLSATDGTVTVDGYDVMQNPVKVKERIGYLPEIPPLYQDMTVWESLRFAYELKRVKLDRDRHLNEICDLVKISDVKDRLVKNLSKGYRQRVGLGCALIGNPPILILDEPTVGLDPKQIIEIRNLITKLAKTRTVILSSHILPEIQAVCGRIIIINKGKIVADNTPDNLTAAQAKDHRLILQAPGEPGEIKKLLKSIPQVSAVEAGEVTEPGVHHYFVDAGGEDVRKEVFFLMAEHKIPLMELSYKHVTLEDAFLKLTKEGYVPAEPEAAKAQDAPQAAKAQESPAAETDETQEGAKTK